MMSITVVLVEDHAIVRDGVRACLDRSGDFVVIGEADSIAHAGDLLTRLRPDVIVTDVVLQDGEGWDVIRYARQTLPSTAVVVLSMLSDPASVSRALYEGALGYVAKELGVEYLADAIRAATAGRRYVGPSVSPRIDDRLIASYAVNGRARYLDLTARERDVFHLVVQGESNPAIAARLEISRRTVEVHRARVMRKLGCRTQADLFHYALGWK